MRELKPLLCELCKEACASQPEDLVGFFVNALERRPVFLSPLYHMERVGAVGGSMGSFEPPPDRASFDELVADVRARLVAPVDQSQFKVDHAFHNAKVERLELPAWWLPEDKWELVWFDDFNYVGLPDPRRWGFQTSCNRWVHDSTHQELQHYTAGRKENAWVQDGVLRITACRERLGGCDYTSARLLVGRVGIRQLRRRTLDYGIHPIRAHAAWDATWARGMLNSRPGPRKSLGKVLRTGPCKAKAAREVSPRPLARPLCRCPIKLPRSGEGPSKLLARASTSPSIGPSVRAL
ncbi:hypothetical protein M885DRAFT_274848 [Pelagophyceae sp. CCMP2097]|nr:hypothetical protein M885DRAFT_274848 [Pelagophyceae sp. CCMP2097]